MLILGLAPVEVARLATLGVVVDDAAALALVLGFPKVRFKSEVHKSLFRNRD